MAPPSAPPRREYVTWQRLLLTVSLLTFWNPPTTAQVTVESVPSNVAGGKDVLLLVHNLPQNSLAYNWYKGQIVDATQRIATYSITSQTQSPGPAHSGRQTIYHNASLLIQNVTLIDTGFYTIQIITANFQNAEATGQFRIYPELPKPSITSNNSDPVENKDSITLTCEPETLNTTYLWWINGQSLPVSPRLELSRDNRTLTLFNVTRNDTGPYECGTQNPVSYNRSDPVNLNVLYGPDTPTISPTTSYYQSGANLNLSCNADSNPPARYFWFFNGSLLQSTQNLVIPSIAVSDNGSYTCLAHNSVTDQNSTTDKMIIVSAELPKPYITSNNSKPVENKDSVALTCEPEILSIAYTWWINGQNASVSSRLVLSKDNRTLTILSVTRNDKGRYECETRSQDPVSHNHSDPFTLDVLYGPDAPTISPPESSFSSGTDLRLSCNAASNPPAQYSWLINDKPQQSTQELVITKITTKNSGSYSCLAHNAATGSNSTTVKKITVSDGRRKPPQMRDEQLRLCSWLALP
ncbi:carcinoembryonic antigen-related cell adhesion molecule 6-like [Carlito syrichta]|uniref:Carcinoembryonic antigen-related cell adhesion molecule 6-like n=1 Tax=Carlito syrichta TaxID=1868482 RepID=A0A3Q0DGH7_CARSF|nr:carcinoembryonic antigen-related cell adhesion molecule 6-like [Carlito syrichta]